MKINLKKLLDKTFFKFILVGIANTLAGSAIMFVFYNIFHFGYWISSASNYIFGSILSYFLNKYYTFKSRDSSIAGVLKFIVNISVCYAVSYGLAKPLVALALSGAPKTVADNLALLVGMGLFVILNYIGQRFFVFRKKNPER